MELMAASRVIKAQQAVRESTYARAITRAVSLRPTQRDHPLIGEKQAWRAGVVIITSDRLAGAYSSSVIKRASDSSPG